MSESVHPRRRWILILVAGVFLLVVVTVAFLTTGHDRAEERFQEALARLQREGLRVSSEELWSDLPDEQNAFPLWQRMFGSDVPAPGSEPSALQAPASVALGEVFNRAAKDWSSLTVEETTVLRDYMTSTSAIFEDLRRLASKKGFWIPENRGRLRHEWVMPRLAGVSQTLKRQILFRGRLALDEGNRGQARECCRVGSQLARVCRACPTYLTALFGHAVLSLTLPLLEETVKGQPLPEDWVREMIGLLDPVRFKQEVLEAVDGERLYQLGFLRLLFSGGPIPPHAPVSSANALTSIWFRRTVRTQAARIVDLWADILKALRKPFWEGKLELARIEKEIAQSRGLRGAPALFLGTISLGRWSKLTETETRLSVVRLALAAKLYTQRTGSPPPSLAALIPEFVPEVALDPFTGNSFHYVVLPRGGFLISSAGPNQIHDIPNSASWTATEPAFALPAPGDDLYWLEPPAAPPSS